MLLPCFVQVSKFKQLSYARWLCFLDVNMPLEEYFSAAYIPLDCEFLIVQGDQTVHLTEVYHLQKPGNLQMYHIATWTSLEGMIWHSSSNFYKRRGNLQGAIIKGTVLPYVSFC